MFITKPQKFTLTLFVYLALALTLAASSEAKGYAAGNVHRRDHVNLKRLVRKRSPFPQHDGTAPVLAVAPAGSSSTSAASTESSTTSSTVSSATPQSSTTSSSSSSTSSVTTSATSSSASSSSSSASSSSSSSSSSGTTSSATTTPTLSTPPPPPPAQTSESLNLIPVPSGSTTVVGSKTIVTLTSSATAASATSSVTAAATTSKGKSTTLTVLIAVASSVGGVAILWTIFRKWKLARSSKFDERLQPIDWQPTNPDDGIIPAHRRINSNASSFHSGLGHGENAAGRGVGGGYGGYGATSDLGHGGSDHGHGAPPMAPIPDHDFTAVPSTLAPVGGYADLARGPSPQPQMHEALARGPSMSRPNYDIGVPLHHQAGYGAADAYDYNGGAVRF